MMETPETFKLMSFEATFVLHLRKAYFYFKHF